MSVESQMNPMRHSKAVFICSPSLGILDMWLPVLRAVKSDFPDLEISIVFPALKTVSKLEPSDVIFDLSSALFTEVIFNTESSGWVRVDDLTEAKRYSSKLNFVDRALKFLTGGDLNQPRLAASRLSRPYKILGSLRRYLPPFVSRAIAQSIGATVSVSLRSRRVEILSFLNPDSMMFFDIHQSQNPAVSLLLAEANDVRKFSLDHAVGARETIPSCFSLVNSEHVSNTSVFMSSEKERAYYSALFPSLEDKDLIAVGVPKHAPEWISLLEATDSVPIPFKSPYIFLISRPGGSPDLPEDRRIGAIEAIKLVAQKFGLKIVVRLHPKEGLTGTYEKILGRSSRGHDWDYSSAHPYRIGRGAAFAVTFHSSVCIDMIQLGVPVIETLSLAGLEKFDNETSQRDTSGNPVYDFRRLGMVLGAENRNALMKTAEMCLANPLEVAQSQAAAYRGWFKESSASISEIAGIIGASIVSGRPGP